MLYNHRVNTHHRQKRASKTKRYSKIVLVIILLGALVIGIDILITELKPKDAEISSLQNSTVQSAQINIFQTPYFRFEADSNWKEVSDQYNNPEKEYIYRRYDNKLIEHELWITVGEKSYAIERHYPTRILPVRIESNGRLTGLGPVSDRCEEVVKDGNHDPRTVKQLQIEYFCHPNSTAYNVTLGIPGGSNSLPFDDADDQEIPITIIYKNVTAYPNSRELLKIIETFSVVQSL